MRARNEREPAPPDGGLLEQGQTTGNAQVDALLQGVTPGGPAEPIGGIGISGPTSPYDRFAQERVVDTTLLALPPDMRDRGVPSSYVAGDESVIWRGLPFEDRVRLQDRLVAYGLAPSAILGELDDSTRNGIKRLLSMSNRSATNWRATLGRLQDLQDQGLLEREQAAEFEADPYLAPDYASWAQLVKDEFERQLGREPDQGEMAEFVGELQGWDKQNYRAQVAGERASFEGEGEGLTIQGVDPVARFQQRFAQVYGGELDFVEDKKEATQVHEGMQRTIGLTRDMIERGY